MATIGLVVRTAVGDAVSLAQKLRARAADNGHDVIVESSCADAIGAEVERCEPAELCERADPIVTLGGDGTLIGVGRYVGESSPLMVGVNFGTLGFLTEIKPAEVFEAIDLAISGGAPVGERHLLSVRVSRGDQEIFSSRAVNDAVVQKGTRSPLLELDLTIEEEEVMRLRADGVIVSSATGSTAYSLAAGGSIVHPGVDAVLVTPICAHGLTNRPFVLPMAYAIDVQVADYSGEVFLTVDGQESCVLQPKDRIQVVRAGRTVRFMLSDQKSYFDILRRKLNWGLANKND